MSPELKTGERRRAGDGDLSGLKAREAEVEISGAGKATVAPTDRARLEISGMGEIELLTRPAQLETDISGAGRIRQPPVSQPAAAPKAGAGAT